MGASPADAPARGRRSRLVPALLGVLIALVFGAVGLGVGVYVALVRGGFINPSWTEANIDASRERAARIIAALSAYNADNGVYPERLADLSPAYIQDLPAPVAGVPEWTYGATDAGREFVLQFSANRLGNPTSWYESRHEGWFVQVREHVEAD